MASGAHPAAAGRRRAGLLRRICIGIMLLATLEFVVATTGVQILNLPRSTDFATYYLAGAQARDGLSPYDTAAIAERGYAMGFEYEQFPFLYPPAFALAMQPLSRVSYPRARQIWMLVATWALFAALACTVQLLRHQANLLRVEESTRTWIVLAAFFPAALNSTSVHNDIRAGSVGILLYLALLLVAAGLVVRSRWLTGTALALASLLKLTPALLILYAAWRRNRAGAGIASALLLCTVVAAWVHWGWEIMPEYARALLDAVSREYPRPMNQSLDAALSRLLLPSAQVAAPFDLPRVKQVLALLLTGVIVAATLYSLRPSRRHPGLLPVELGYVVLALLLIMKITWLHTLTSMLFVWPFLMLPILRAAERGARWALPAGLWACFGFLLSSAHIPVLWQGLRAGAASLFISVHVVGLLILWFVSRTVLQHEEDCC
jgi:hypothetical protein